MQSGVPPPVRNARLCYCRRFLFLLRTVSVPCSPTMSLVPFISMQPSTVFQSWPCSPYSILCARCFLPGLCAIESVWFNVTQSLLHLRSPFISYHVQLPPSCALLWRPLVPRYPARDSCAPQFFVFLLPPPVLPTICGPLYWTLTIDHSIRPGHPLHLPLPADQ